MLVTIIDYENQFDNKIRITIKVVNWKYKIISLRKCDEATNLIGAELSGKY